MHVFRVYLSGRTEPITIHANEAPRFDDAAGWTDLDVWRVRNSAVVAVESVPAMEELDSLGPLNTGA